MFSTNSNYSSPNLFIEKRYTSGEKLMVELSQYSPCRTLIDEAQKAAKENGLGLLKVRFEQIKSGFDAEQDSNVIRIMPDLTAAQQRSCFVFELTNLIQHKKHMEIWDSALKGVYKNPEEYARAKEYVEFCGIRREKSVSQVMNKKMGYVYLENPWENLPLERMEFDVFYNSHLPDSHKEYYRKEWKRQNNFKKFLKIAICVITIAVVLLYRT